MPVKEKGEGVLESEDNFQTVMPYEPSKKKACREKHWLGSLRL